MSLRLRLVDRAVTLTPVNDVRDASNSASSESLTITDAVRDAMADLALREYPLEACGLMAGPAGSNTITRFFPCQNVEKSARIYTIDPRDHLRAERTGEDAGLEIRGVMHSHTHTEAFPSPTDVAAAPDPDWHYLIVTLKRETPEMRTFRIRSGHIDEISLLRG